MQPDIKIQTKFHEETRLARESMNRNSLPEAFLFDMMCCMFYVGEFAQQKPSTFMFES